jgi:ribosomal protein S18 acetylase RimI-like enzyme
MGRPEEAPAIARLVLEAHAPFYRYCFQDDDQLMNFLNVAAADERSELFAGRALVARLDGMAAGVAIFNVIGDQPAFRRRDAFLLRAALPKPAGDSVFKRMRAAAGMFAAPAATALYLSRLAVAAKARGCGIGRRLIRHLHQEAAVRGRTAVELHVAATNLDGIRFYHREGFTEVALVASTIPELPDYIRMACFVK